MKRLINKRIRSEKIFRICFIIIAVLWVCSFLTIPFFDFNVYCPALMVSTLAVIPCTITYFVKNMPFLRNLKWLKSKGFEDIADDINPENTTFPRSKVCCGQKALFSKYPFAIIPYEEIAWLYKYERRTNGILVERSIIIYTKDGKRFSIGFDEKEFAELLHSYILPNTHNLILGYGVEQKAKYRELYPDTNGSGKKAKKIWGIILVSLGVVMLIAGIINQTILSPGIVIALGALVAGIILFITGSKK